MAERRKEIKETDSFCKADKCSYFTRKMRLVADIIRGEEVNRALDILKYSKKEAAIRLEQLVRSAIANWEAKTRLTARSWKMAMSILKPLW